MKNKKKRIQTILTGWIMILTLTASLFGVITPSAASISRANITQFRRITANKAMKIAKKRVGGGVVADCDLDYENGVLAYEVEIHKGKYEYDVFVKASNGKILTGISVLPSQKKITLAKAKTIALKKASGGFVTDWDLDNEFGTQVYEIEIRKGQYEYDITIKASNGRVLSSHREYDD
ncbi:MAG: PepSY domain-containing protein [Lachnoclostridium sp.]|jgi:uncharacterized membrane protein YkoI|nr:PepSY domain-containing protein [Lachnoclostridium sp.]